MSWTGWAVVLSSAVVGIGALALFLWRDTRHHRRR